MGPHWRWIAAGTRVGAVILGEGFEVRSSGWNGAARGCDADKDWRTQDHDKRLLWAVHAEANAIANAARCGTPLAGSTLVVTHMPCMACAKLIVQAGIVQVLCPTPSIEFRRKWAVDFIAARELFMECGVSIHLIDTLEG